MAMKAVQHFQFRFLASTEEETKSTLQAIKDAGYDGIELCGVFLRPLPQEIMDAAEASGYPIPKCGDFDWKKVVKESGLSVISILEDLDGILAYPDFFISEAKEFGTDCIVVGATMFYDYSDMEAVLNIAEKLNRAGKILEERGLHLLYHNHNCEMRKVNEVKTAYQVLVENTDPKYVNFEFDPYWPTNLGCDVMGFMNMLGNRMQLMHITDRGFRNEGPTTPIIEPICMELGYGNMNLTALVDTAKSFGVKAIILETHSDWIDNSPIKSLQLSAKFMNEHV